MSFATPTQFRARYDARMLGGLVADDGTQVSASNLLTDDNLQAMLDDATGAITAAMRASDRYTADQLATLSGDNKHLVRVCCDIALSYLVDRRLHYVRMTDGLQRLLDRSEKHLEDLRAGKDIFDIGQAASAGKPSAPDANTVTRTSQEDQTTVRWQTRNYYPVPRTRGF